MKPIIGLALGSGAARGWSHIGVIEGLAALGIKPQIVAGTSIGALVGAALATGNLESLKKRAERFARSDIAGMFDVGFSTGGLIEGRRIEAFLDQMEIRGEIESLDIRFAAVAANLASGREVWLQNGPIGAAVRSSMSMPGVLAPTRDHDRAAWLIDGGLVDPVPVSLARALGSDVVIAVDLNSDLVGRRFIGKEEPQKPSTFDSSITRGLPQWLSDAANPILERIFQTSPTLQYPSYFEVLANSLNIMQDRITRMRLAGDPPEILLCPRLGEFSWLDFHRAQDAIAAGRECVETAEEAIRRIVSRL